MVYTWPELARGGDRTLRRIRSIECCQAFSASDTFGACSARHRCNAVGTGTAGDPADGSAFAGASVGDEGCYVSLYNGACHHDSQFTAGSGVEGWHLLTRPWTAVVQLFGSVAMSKSCAQLRSLVAHGRVHHIPSSIEPANGFIVLFGSEETLDGG